MNKGFLYNYVVHYTIKKKNSEWVHCKIKALHLGENINTGDRYTRNYHVLQMYKDDSMKCRSTPDLHVRNCTCHNYIVMLATLYNNLTLQKKFSQ